MSTVSRPSSIVALPESPPGIPASPTPPEIVRRTWQALGFTPTTAQIRYGIQDILALRTDGFSLAEIGEGAMYAAQHRWIRSFAGVKLRLPQALKAVRQRAERRPGPDRAVSVGGDAVSVLPAPVAQPSLASTSPHRELWDQVLALLQDRVQRQSYKTWFLPSFIAEYDGKRAIIEVPSAFHREWMEAHYHALLEATFGEAAGHPVGIEFRTPLKAGERHEARGVRQEEQSPGNRDSGKLAAARPAPRIPEELDLAEGNEEPPCSSDPSTPLARRSAGTRKVGQWRAPAECAPAATVDPRARLIEAPPALEERSSGPSSAARRGPRQHGAAETRVAGWTSWERQVEWVGEWQQPAPQKET